MAEVKDIAPELLKKIQEDFAERFARSEKIKRLAEKITGGAATYAEANEYAIETGELLAAAFKDNLSSDVLPDGKMYFNIGDRVVRIPMENNHRIVSEMTAEVQKGLNDVAGIGIAAQAPELNEDRIDGIVNRLSHEDDFDRVAWILQEPIVNFTQSIVDDAIRENADFHSRSGMSPKIIRRSTGKCCEWCDKLAGTYDYDSVKNTGNDVFRRHQRCRCTVNYVPVNGKVQNVHSKIWSSEGEEERKALAKEFERDILEKQEALKKAARIVESENQKARFVPAATLKEAEDYAKRFVVDSYLKGNGVVSYKGISVEVANHINETLTRLFDEMDIPKLNSIQPMNLRSKIFKDSKDAPFCYRGMYDGDLYFNPKFVKTEAMLSAGQHDSKDAFDFCLRNKDSIDAAKRKIVDKCIASGRQIIADDCSDYLKALVEHEVGHHLQYQVLLLDKKAKDVITKGMPKHSEQISGYATNTIGEYIAESFSAFRNGYENIIDTELRAIFERLVK